jgi:putative hemolysin
MGISRNDERVRPTLFPYSRGPIVQRHLPTSPVPRLHQRLQPSPRLLARKEPKKGVAKTMSPLPPLLLFCGSMAYYYKLGKHSSWTMTMSSVNITNLLSSFCRKQGYQPIKKSRPQCHNKQASIYNFRIGCIFFYRCVFLLRISNLRFFCLVFLLNKI